jgi:low affinity Fe/Cu permease
MIRAIRLFAAVTPRLVGSPWAFLFAILLTAAWLCWGLVAGFTDRWLLVPSALASVVTFVIAFSLQYTQNRDTRAIQLKLDEMLRALERHELVRVEQLPDDVLARVEQELVDGE